MTDERHILTEREEDILQALYTYHFLTVNQVTRLFFAPSSKHYAGCYLRRLTQYSLLTRFPLPTTRKGNREYVYTLSSDGYRHLHALGKNTPSHHSPTPEVPSFHHLQHTLAVNDVLIAATLLPRLIGCVTIADLRSEWMLKRSPLHLSLEEKTGGRRKAERETIQQNVIPDGWLDFRLHLAGKTYQSALWVEVDLATEEQKQFRRKVRGLHVVATSSTCLAQLGVKAFTIALMNTIGGEKRRDQLRMWIREELTQLGRLQDASLFLFTALSPGGLNPQTLFLSPIWTTTLDDSPLPLLDLS